MDLLQTVRKEGSRGGVNFSWDDVKSSQHRENYLGHSLMAPVGRWQKGKDLNWYAKADDAELTPEEREERERQAKREEMRKIKEAEEDAMARALGLPVPDRTNANNEPLGEGKISQKKVNKALREALDDGEEQSERGAGLDSRRSETRRDSDRKSGRTHEHRRRHRSRSRDGHHRSEDRHRDERRRRRSRSRSRDRDRERRHRRSHRSRSPSQPRERQRRSRSRDWYEEDRHRRRRDHNERSRSHDRERRRHRSRSR